MATKTVSVYDRYVESVKKTNKAFTKMEKAKKALDAAEAAYANMTAEYLKCATEKADAEAVLDDFEASTRTRRAD